MLALLLAVLPQNLEEASAPARIVVDRWQERSPGFVDANPKLVATRSGVLIACSARRVTFDEVPEIRVQRSLDGGLTWSDSVSMGRARDAQLSVHGDAVWLLEIEMEDPVHPRLVLRISRDDGATWTQPADDRHGLLWENFLPGYWLCPLVVREGRVVLTFSREDDDYWGHTIANRADAALGADPLDARNWSWSGEFPLREFGDFMYVQGAWSDGRVPRNVALFVRDWFRPPLPSVRVKVTPAEEQRWRDAAETEKWLDLRSFSSAPIRDPQTGRFVAVIPAPIRTWLPVRALHPRDFCVEPEAPSLEIHTSNDLEHWEFSSTIVRDASGETHPFVRADWLTQGEDLLVLGREQRYGLTAEGVAKTENALVFLRVPNFRERTASSPPLWSATSAK